MLDGLKREAIIL